MPPQFSIVVFSHLRWNFVYQRPQHLLSRLAADRPVLFIEEPIRDDSAPPHWEKQQPAPGVVVYRPHTPVAAPGFHDDQIPPVLPLVDELAQETGGRDYIVWFYTPMALPFAQGLRPRAVVYDCMDELSMFHLAPPGLLQR